MNNFLVKTSGQHLTADNDVKTLMLLHGWGMNSQVWEPIREALERRYHLLWVDLPGHGFNRHVEVKSLEQMVVLIAAVMPENTHLIGWSLGGLVAQALAQHLSQQMPRKIKSLTLVASTPRFSRGIDNDWQYAMSDKALQRFANNLKQDTEKTLKGFIALQFIGVKDGKEAQSHLINQIMYNQKTAKNWGGVLLNSALEPATATVLDHTNIPTQEALELGLVILKRTDLRKLTPSCPEHWMFAEYDRLIPKEVINDLISLRPNAEITLLEEVGHAPFITHSDTFLVHAIAFIDALE